MNQPKEYEAKVMITFSASPQPPSSLRVAETQSGSESRELGSQTSSAKGEVWYFDSNGNRVNPLVVDNNDKLKFSLWKQTSPGPPPVLEPLDGGLVLIGQYSAPDDDKDKRERRSPFDNNDLVLYLKAEEKGNAAWVRKLNRNGAEGKTFFEYCVVALLDEQKLVVPIDPSIIINPN